MKETLPKNKTMCSTKFPRKQNLKQEPGVWMLSLEGTNPGQQRERKRSEAGKDKKQCDVRHYHVGHCFTVGLTESTEEGKIYPPSSHPSPVYHWSPSSHTSELHHPAPMTQLMPCGVAFHRSWKARENQETWVCNWNGVRLQNGVTLRQ